jgi:hypothetical protein
MGSRKSGTLVSTSFICKENCQPIQVAKSIVPVQNRIMFFEVSDRSFHQVAEVLSKTKIRLSINGWFHGPINYRPPTYIELFQNPKDYVNLDTNLFFDWIEEKYLNPINQSEIQDEFVDSSEIKLTGVFNVCNQTLNPCQHSKIFVSIFHSRHKNMTKSKRL